MHTHFHIGIRLLALALCLGTAPMVGADEAADRAAIEATAQAWIKTFNERRTERLLTLTTPDIVLLDAGPAPVSGQAAALETWRRASGAAQGQLAAATKEIVIAGDMAWRIGALVHKLPGGKEENRGQSLEIWQRVNGKWLLHRQMAAGIFVPPQLQPLLPPYGPMLDKQSH